MCKEITGRDDSNSFFLEFVKFILHYQPPITGLSELYIIFRMLIGKTCLRVFKIPTVFAIFADNISI